MRIILRLLILGIVITDTKTLRDPSSFGFRWPNDEDRFEIENSYLPNTIFWAQPDNNRIHFHEVALNSIQDFIIEMAIEFGFELLPFHMSS